jgi:hypothetical protein
VAELLGLSGLIFFDENGAMVLPLVMELAL